MEKIIIPNNESDKTKNPTYRFAHMGVNNRNTDDAFETVRVMQRAFDFQMFDIGNSIMVEGSFEIIKSMGRGSNGHIAIETEDVFLAIKDLTQKGFTPDMETIQYQSDGQIMSVYLKEEIGGFAFHLLKKR